MKTPSNSVDLALERYAHRITTRLDEGLAEMVEWGRRHIEQLKLAPTEYTLYA